VYSSVASTIKSNFGNVATTITLVIINASTMGNGSMLIGKKLISVKMENLLALKLTLSGGGLRPLFEFKLLDSLSFIRHNLRMLELNLLKPEEKFSFKH
jgi:hypothetical protein